MLYIYCAKIVRNLKVPRPNSPQFTPYHNASCTQRNTINETSFFIKLEGFCYISVAMMGFFGPRTNFAQWVERVFAASEDKLLAHNAMI